MHRNKRLSILFLLTPFLAAILHGQDLYHFEKKFQWRNSPLTSEIVEEKLHTAATEYSDQAPIPRIALYDLALPADSAECDRLHGDAVILVTAVVQDSSEIPLARCYLESEGKTVPLQSFARLESRVPDGDAIVAHVFGRYRCNAFYLFPVRLHKENTKLLVDFKSHRTAFHLDELSETIPPPSSKAYTDNPPTEEVLQFIVREFPGVKTVLEPEKTEQPHQ